MEQTGLFSLMTLIGGLWLLFWLTAALLPLLTTGRVLAAARNPLEGHLSGQLLRLGGVCAAVQLVGLLVAVGVFWTPLQALLPQPEVQSAATPFMALTLGGTILSMGLWLGWKTLRKQRVTVWLLFLVVILFATSLWPLLTLSRLLWLDAGGTAFLFAKPLALSLPWFSESLPVPKELVLMGDGWLYGPGAAGGMSLLWLLIRRNKDDFGRDYYGFAARACASFAAFGGLLAIMNSVSLTQSLLALFGNPLTPGLVLPAWLTDAGERVYGLLGPETVQRAGLETVPHALGFLCLALTVFHGLAALTWFMISRAALPMRCKIAMGIGFLLYCAGLLLALDLFRLAHTLVLPPIL